MTGKPTCEELEQRVKELEKEVEKRKLAEEELEKYLSLSEQSADAIYISTREGEFVYFNQSFLNLFGYTKEEIENLEFQDLYANIEDRSGFLQEIEKTGSIRDFEIKLCKKDGTEIDCLITANIRQADDGSILEYQGIIRDITEKKKLEVQFQQAQKMESIGILASGIAHDFNNILMGIQGYDSLILMDIDSTHPHHERLIGIEQQIQSGADLTKQLLEFASGGEYEPRPSDLNELIKNQNRMFGRTKKEITIRGNYEKNLWTVEIDQGQIKQVFLNLYVNAWQAMTTCADLPAPAARQAGGAAGGPGEGNLYIQTENITLDEDYVRPYQMDPGRYVKITVTDTGIGMDEATQQRIFEPFFTTKETKKMGKGTGLGLASVYGIIKNHNGIIDVYSKENEGTTFTIYLPASEKKIIKEELKGKILDGSETVLLVDDEDVIIEVSLEILNALGYQVLTARSGKEAIEVYKKNKDKIELVILDMIMPDLGGGETYDRIKGINPDIKVLLLSGYSTNGQAQEILDRGCDGFIQKPFNMKQVSQKLREILDKK